ncbi:MAG: anti-sigma factor antagonist [Solirubrobacteraceae bacterium]|nr:anti-sigma factor antagonist [Solirubrobacteraceae bacterium]
MRFFGFFVFFGFTGACGVRTADGETPPVRPLGEVDFVPEVGATPPDELPVEVLPLGAPVPPVAAAALVVAQASASSNTAMASAERNRLPPCMGLGSDPRLRALRNVVQIWPCSPLAPRGNNRCMAISPPRYQQYSLEGPRHVVVAEGAIDMRTAPLLAAALAEPIELGKTHVVLDMSGVTLVDSMAVHVLMGAARDLRQRLGKLVLVSRNPSVRRVFELTRLDLMAPLYESREAALRGLIDA